MIEASQQHAVNHSQEQMNMSFPMLGSAADPLAARREFLGKSGVLLSGCCALRQAWRRAFVS
jgi:hypothetical protein